MSEGFQRVADVGLGGHPDLAAPVVPTDRHFHPQRQAEGVGSRGGPEVLDRPDLTPRRDRDAGRLDEATLLESVLGDDERKAPRPDGDLRVDRIDDRRRHVFEFVRHDVGQVGEPERRPDIVVRAHDDPVRHRGGRAIGVGVEHDDAIAHGPRGEAEHPSELAATEDADRGRGQDGRGAARCALGRRHGLEV